MISINDFNQICTNLHPDTFESIYNNKERGEIYIQLINSVSGLLFVNNDYLSLSYLSFYLFKHNYKVLC